MAKTGRTPEEIRDAARAELPALLAMQERFKALHAELHRTPEYRHWLAHFEDLGWDESEEALKYEALTDLSCALGELVGDSSPGHVLPLFRRATNPKAWTIAAARAQRARIRRRQAKAEAREAPSGTSPRP